MTVDTIERSRAHLVVIADLAAQAAKHDDEALRHTALGIELRQTIATLERVFGAEKLPDATAQEDGQELPVSGVAAIAIESEDSASDVGQPSSAPIPDSAEPPSNTLAETGEGVRPHALPDPVAEVPSTEDGANAGGENEVAQEISTPRIGTDFAATLNINAKMEEGAAAPSSKLTPTRLSEQVREAHAAHPDWTIREIADHVGCSTSLAGRWLKEIRGPVRPAEGETLGDKLKQLVDERGSVTMREAIEAIGGTPGGIAAAAKRERIVLRKATPEEHAANTRAGMAAKSSEPLLEKDANPHGLGCATRKDAPTAAPKPVVEVSPPVRARASVSVRFYLRDERGRYLHQSLERSPTDTGPLMTSNRQWAWFDNERRYEGALRKWPGIAALRREVPTP